MLERTAKADRQAFRSLYDASSAKLMGVLMRILKNREKAEDVLQEVYVKIWQKADTYDASLGRPITWMATIARNRAIDVVRATRVETTLDEPGSEESLYQMTSAATLQSPTDELESLRHCLGELAEDTREYVLLAYYQGYSREELAERYKSPIGTIKTRLRRGLLALKECLDVS